MACYATESAHTERRVLGQFFATIGNFAWQAVPFNKALQCTAGFLVQSWHCNGEQWGDAAVSSVVDPGSLLLGGPLDKLALKLGEKGLALVAEGVIHSCGCFVEDTLVETPTGLVAIQEIKVGDQVLAYDEQSHALVAEPVIALIRPEAKETFALAFKGGHGELDSFRATADHRWFTVNHGWVHTSDLKVGDQIETARGETLALAAIGLSGKVEQTYNLEVQGLHTFLVGKDHLVVHNGLCNLLGQEGEEAVRAIYDIGEKPTKAVSINGRDRLPDGLTDTSLSEVKNVATQGWTQQLRDYAEIAKQRGILFNLFTNADTKLRGLFCCDQYTRLF